MAPLIVCGLTMVSTVVFLITLPHRLTLRGRQGGCHLELPSGRVQLSGLFDVGSGSRQKINFSRFIGGSLQAAGRNYCARLLSGRAASAAGGHKQRVTLTPGRKSLKAARKQK